MKYKRIVVNKKGEPSSLQLIEEEMAEPRAGEARVKIAAAGVAIMDIMVRKGMIPLIPRTPFTPGLDIVGIIDKVGADSSLSVGQSVAALMPRFGGYTEFANVPEKWLVPVPGGLDPAEVVSIILNYLTAYCLLYKSAKVKSGERILVHGAAGGVGTALLELGALAKLEMYGTASKGKHGLISELGATPIDYRNEDFVEKIHNLTGDGVDVVFDGIGGRNFSRSYKTLRRGGRLVSYGFIGSLKSGKTSEIPLTLARIVLYKLIPDGKRAILYGSTAGFAKKDMSWYGETLTELMDLIKEGKIKPIVGERLPLSEAPRAHEIVEKSAARGAVVLICNEQV